MVDIDRYIPYQDYYFARIGKAKKSGNQLTGLCPFHDDRGESFSVNLLTGQWNCFAGCGSGNVIGFHAKKCGVNEKDALKNLCRIYNVPSSKGGKRGPDPDQAKPDAKTIPLKTLDLFRVIPPEVLSYLQEKRGWSLEIIQRHQVGYNAKLRFSPGNIGEERITIPIFDEFGELANIRSYQPGAAQNKLMSWSTGSKKKGTWQGFGEGRLFPLSALGQARSEGKIVYLIEGEPDCLCGLSRELLCITSTFGADNWKDEWNALFKGLHVRIAYDNDEAGRKGMARVCEHLPTFAEKVECITWPEWMGEKEDLTDWFQKYGKTKKDFEELPWAEAQPKSESESAADIWSEVRQEIAKLNERHAVVMLGGRCLIINEFNDPTFNRPAISFSNPDNFKNYYSNQRYYLPSGDGKIKAVPLGKLWFESPDRRQYEGIVFEPAKEVPGYYNLYKGFAEEPKAGNWSLFYNHLKTVIANNNPEVFRYLLAWAAHLFQQPGGQRPGVSIVLRGEQGTGKGCFASQIGKICGSHFLHITKSQQLTGKFNSHLKDALFVFCDEGVWAGDKQAEGALKAMITEDYVAIEPKGKDVFMVKNYIRLLIASNNSWVVPAGIGERRFCVLDVPETRKQDHVYFKAIFDQMDNGGRAAMLHDLLQLDISDFNLWNFPKTDALFDQIQRTLDPVPKYWLEKLTDGLILPVFPNWDDLVPVEKMYKDFLEFCKNTGERYPPAKNVFCRELRKVCPSIEKKYVPADMYGKREWAMKCSSLEECREKFVKALGLCVNWADQVSLD
jgi:hypothetical protein